MKTLQQISREIRALQEEMMCQKIGNDFYYTSPLYRRHTLALTALEAEKEAIKENLKRKKMQKNKKSTGQA